MSEVTNWLVIRGGHQFRLGSGMSEERQREMLVTLCTFLNENNLVANTLPTGEGYNWDSFELRASQLNARGFLVVKAGLNSWLMGIDRGSSPQKITVLKRALDKVNQHLAACHLEGKHDSSI